MNIKKCKFCNSVKVIRWGFQNNKQRYKCKVCNKLLIQEKQKNSRLAESLFNSFVFGKQNISELAKEYHIRKTKVQSTFDEYVLPIKIHKPRDIYLIIDGTYFNSSNTEDAFCLILFRDAITHENVWWKFTQNETEHEYSFGRYYLESLGYNIKGVTGDGLAMIDKVFYDIKRQTCLVHVSHFVQRKTGKKPILEANMALLALSKVLFKLDADQFRSYLFKYQMKFKDFLNERYYSYDGKKRKYIHEETRSGIAHLWNRLPYMFIYKRDKNIPRTSNSIEGHFRHIKLRVQVHHGISKIRKQKLIEAILLNSSVRLN